MNVQHVYPLGDLIEHDTDSDDCVCGPTTEFGDGWAVVVHHSLDGREAHEGKRKRRRFRSRLADWLAGG